LTRTSQKHWDRHSPFHHLLLPHPYLSFHGCLPLGILRIFCHKPCEGPTWTTFTQVYYGVPVFTSSQIGMSFTVRVKVCAGAYTHVQTYTCIWYWYNQTSK
jgi:hypothetical protein